MHDLEKRLASAAKADILLNLTDVDGVALNHRMAEERFLRPTTRSEARRHLEGGHFAEVNMEPKVLAGVRFVENGGESCIIASLDRAWEALQGKAGTRITP